MNTDQLAYKYRHISREAAPLNKLTYDGLTGRMAGAAYVAHHLDTLHMTLQEARDDALVQAERRGRMAARPDEPQDYREYCAEFAQVLREFIADADADVWGGDMRVRMKQVEKARWGFLIPYLHCTACRKTTPQNEFHVGQFPCLYCEAINAMPPEQATAYQRAWEEKRQRAANEEAT